MRGSSPFHVGPSMTPRACSFTSVPSLESFLTRVFMSEPMMVWPSASWLRASAADTGRRHSVSSLAMWDVIALSPFERLGRLRALMRRLRVEHAVRSLRSIELNVLDSHAQRAIFCVGLDARDSVSSWAGGNAQGEFRCEPVRSEDVFDGHDAAL